MYIHIYTYLFMHVYIRVIRVMNKSVYMHTYIYVFLYIHKCTIGVIRGK